MGRHTAAIRHFDFEFEFDVSSLSHCGELHNRIGILMTFLSEQQGYPLIECARCATVMVRQVEDNDVMNRVMEVCSRCTHEMDVEDGQ